MITAHGRARVSVRWSKDEVAYLLVRAAAKVPLRQIARENNRTVTAIQAKLVALRSAKRVESRLRRWTDDETAQALTLLEQGASLKAAAKAVERTVPALKMHLWKRGHIRPDADRPWTADEVERARTMRETGSKMGDVAEAVGRTRAAVWGKLTYMAKVRPEPRVLGP